LPSARSTIFGLIVADLIAEPMDLRNPPPPGGLVITRSVKLAPGGNVCNVATAMAKLGVPVGAAGIVGDDVLGQAVVAQMKSSGVDVASVRTSSEKQTSATVVAIEPGGERVFFHTPGVNELLDADAFLACFDAFAKSAYVQVGYLGLLPKLTPDLPDLFARLKRTAPHVKIAFDTVNPPGPRAALLPILPHVDVFCPSRTEAASLTGKTDPHAMLDDFRAHMKGDAIVGVKLDAEGCLIDAGGKRSTTPAYKIDVVDTTGAGDTWFGGLLAGLVRGMPIEQATKLANRAAADCCTAIGASAGVRSFEETLGRV
jgi:sugar/nucleoside kinase (ribokinase family)